VKEAKVKCKGTITKGDKWHYDQSPCPRNAITEGFCKLHHPDRGAKELVEWRAKWAAEEQAKQKADAVSACKEAVLDAAEKARDCKGTIMQVDAAVDALRKAREL
jgi:hypothetical protein